MGCRRPLDDTAWTLIFTMLNSIRDSDWNMASRDLLFIATCIFVMNCLGLSTAWAGVVVCPVCGESFDDSLGECPNDGTDLRLLGKDKPPSSPDNEAPSQKEPDPDGANPENAAKSKKGPILYNRHDEGGSRKIAESEENGAGYSDRQSRLPKDSRMKNAPKPKRDHSTSMEQSRAAPDDSAVLDDFERRRKHSWEEWENIRLQNSKLEEHRAAVRRKLLMSLGAPLTSLGGRIFWMGESNYPGPVGAAEIDVNIIRYKVRAGMSTLLGIRALNSRNDLVFLESLNIGMQWPGRFSPYVIAKGGVGVLATSRSGVDDAYLLSAFGTETGIDVWLHPWLAITPSVGYMISFTNDKYWNSFTCKVAVGF